MIANDNSIIIIVIIIATVLSLSLLLSLLLLLYLTNHTVWCGHHMSTHNSSITSADIQGWTAWLGMALSSLCHGWHSLSILNVRTLRDGNHLTCHSFSILVNHPTMKAQHSQTPMSWTSFSNSSHLNSRMNYSNIHDVTILTPREEKHQQCNAPTLSLIPEPVLQYRQYKNLVDCHNHHVVQYSHRWPWSRWHFALTADAIQQLLANAWICWKFNMKQAGNQGTFSLCNFLYQLNLHLAPTGFSICKGALGGVCLHWLDGYKHWMRSKSLPNHACCAWCGKSSKTGFICSKCPGVSLHQHCFENFHTIAEIPPHHWIHTISISLSLSLSISCTISMKLMWMKGLWQAAVALHSKQSTWNLVFVLVRESSIVLYWSIQVYF